MAVFSFSAILAALHLFSFLGAVMSAPAPAPLAQTPIAQDGEVAAASSYWVANVARNGKAAFNPDPNYKVFRNVKDYGARGDGVTDDTAALNRAVSEGNRCGLNCDSQTTTPALVYFPPGTYIVSKPIIQYYYSQFVGDAVDLPVLKAAPNFEGIAVIDADPYKEGGFNWYTNQNNFFRQIRNFVIDVTAQPPDRGTGIHWQVAQATSLQNIRFEMRKGGGTQQQGIFMENGSGGFFTDLTFNGGKYGAFLGSQQFTTRNLVFNDCETGIFMNWNWAWTLKSVTFNRCGLALDMANGGFNQTVGSVLLLDSQMVDTRLGIRTSFNADSLPVGGGALILDNVNCAGCESTVVSDTGAQILPGGRIDQWAQGAHYTGDARERTGKAISVNKPAPLVVNGKIFERSKPQYEDVPASQFVSIKAAGAVGDGRADDTAAIQGAIDALRDDQVLYFDHGAYRITQTIKIPGGRVIRLTGEILPLLMANGPFFADEKNPKPMIQVGSPGDVGSFEMSDFIIETMGPTPGAILMQWHLASASAGAGGLWDVHFRVAGTAGTQLQSDKCTKNPSAQHGANPDCIAAFMLLHLAPTASAYLENTWFWVADHELDIGPGYNQIDIYNGRGVLIESQGPVWLYGTASEHNVLYNYQLLNAKNVFMALIQTETPYYQGNPDATTPFAQQTGAPWRDPDFSQCADTSCRKAWGMRVIDTEDFLLYGGGLYSFFENYAQDCVAANNCQTNMVSIEGGAKGVELLGLSTKASVNMLTREGRGIVKDSDNRSNFCGTIARWVAA